MSEAEFLKHQFLTLREEIRACKARAFMILILAAVFIPATGFAAQQWANTFATASLPFITLVLMVAFVAEQNAIIRAGRYIKDHIEPHMKEITTWEKWLESNHRHRDVDRYFFGSFLFVFLLFYAVGAGTAVESLAGLWPEHFWYAAIGYGLGGLWFIVILMRHWHACTTTED